MKKLLIILIIIAIATCLGFYFYNKIQKAAISEKTITKEMAYEGVSNYCNDTYNWSKVEETSSNMYLKMGEETEFEYQVIFRSYTGAFVYFYVNKTTGITRLVEYNPSLNIESEAGTIDLFYYLNSQDEEYNYMSGDNGAINGNPKMLKIYELTEDDLKFEYNSGFDFEKSTIDREIKGTANVNSEKAYEFEEKISGHEYKLVFEFDDNKNSITVYEYDNGNEIGQINLWRYCA